MITRFIVYGEPFGKLNMRPTMRNGHATSFQPSKNASYMQQVKYAFIENKCERFGDQEPLKVSISAFKGVPKSVSKKKARLMLEQKIVPITKPDCDNISKIILDSLTGLAWRDDSQVVEETIKKFYSDTPRVEIVIETWENF